MALAVHDLGGPIGLHWAVGRPERVWALALLNTLVYPELSEAVVDFARTLLNPTQRDQLTNAEYLEAAMRLGVVDERRITPDVVAAVTGPFQDAEHRLALARAGCGLRRPGLAEIAQWLRSVAVPVRIIYGAQDRILPDVAATMARVAEDVPHADVTVLTACGHFLQEDDAETVGTLLGSFFESAKGIA